MTTTCEHKVLCGRKQIFLPTSVKWFLPHVKETFMFFVLFYWTIGVPVDSKCFKVMNTSMPSYVLSTWLMLGPRSLGVGYIQGFSGLVP